jgi:aminomethyltransferase
VLPLSHQDIGSWPFVNTPWDFALLRDKEGKLTKDFIGSGIYKDPPSSYTCPFCGFDPRKVETHGASVLLNDVSIGTVSTCAIDMAIGRVDGKIYSAASPDKPASFKARGLVCGFVRVNRPLEPGTKVTLKDSRRALEVEIVTDIRPNRTARIEI